MCCPLAESERVIHRPATGWPVNRRTNGGFHIAGLVFIACEDEHGDGCIVKYNLSTSHIVRASWAHDGAIAALVFGPYDNGPLFSGGVDSWIKVWDISTLRCIKVIEAYGAYAVQAMVVEKRKGVISLGANGVLKVWSLVMEEES
eukprot:GEMP01091593.1.p2 GENE.GEMP01091593.1~~GEMP01091593.1.p2  ORF type:complete len:145 (+),score=37.58 GEMP01091593.1:55-489(+)